MKDRDQIVGELRRIIEAYGHQTFGPVSEERVRAAEQELGLTFPLSYRLHLREFGAVGDILDLYLYGLPDTRDTDAEQPTYLNVLDQQLSWTPPHLIHLGSQGGGGCWFFLDTSSTDEDGEAHVLIQGHSIPLQVFAPSFVEFLRKFADDPDPFSQVIKDPPRSPPNPTEPEPVEEPEPRSITWLEVAPDAFARDGPPLARQFGVDEDSRDVFVHAPTVGLDLEGQIQAMAEHQGVFANPTGLGGFCHPFVTIDHLILHHPELADAAGMAELGRWVLDAFDQAASGDDE